MELRKFSDGTIKKLKNKVNANWKNQFFDIENRISYMKNSAGLYDLDLAKDLVDLILAEKFTMNPKKQNVKEKKQFELLNLFFNDVKQVHIQTLWLQDGEIRDIKSRKDKLVYFDLDGTIEGDYPLTCKSIDEGGGAQNKQFKEILGMIGEAPDLNSELKPLIVFVIGDYWKEEQQSFDRVKYSGKMSRIEFLKDKAKKFKKKIIIFTENDLPETKMNFSDFVKSL